VGSIRPLPNYFGFLSDIVLFSKILCLVGGIVYVAAVLRSLVCGSDGKPYGSACQMKEEACRKQIILEERPMDNCEGLSL